MITSNITKNKLPVPILQVLKTLQDNGFKGYLVGGCTRDLLIKKTPHDWDITTSATPEMIQSLFPDSFYENAYGTVGVKTTLGVVEVTPFRKETTYSDGRRPDSVVFTDDITEDLARRDFTMNAIAYDPINDVWIDPYGGLKDIELKLIKAVRNPLDRFEEDGLRIMRLVRFIAQLDFGVDTATLGAVHDKRNCLDRIAIDRIRDELIKILESDNANIAFVYMEKMGILKYISQDLENSVNVTQNGCHAYDVFEHLIRSMQCAVDKKYPLHLRIAALFHDIGKPPTRQWSEEKKDYTFYGHEVIGTKITYKILENLHFPREMISRVTKLVRWHMFFSDTEQITPSAVRRMIANVGKENIWDLMNLRICDRVGTGRPKEDPYRLRKYMSLIEEVLSDPTDVSMLKISGNTLMEKFNIPPGPVIGQILNILLEKALDTPSINTVDNLLILSRDMLKLPPNELKILYTEALHTKQQAQNNEINKIRNKYKVR